MKHLARQQERFQGVTGTLAEVSPHPEGDRAPDSQIRPLWGARRAGVGSAALAGRAFRL